MGIWYYQVTEKQNAHKKISAVTKHHSLVVVRNHYNIFSFQNPTRHPQFPAPSLTGSIIGSLGVFGSFSFSYFSYFLVRRY